MTGLALARVRHQPGQSVLVGALAAVLALTAVLGVAYARAVEESVQRSTLSAAAPNARGVSVSVQADKPPSPDELRAELKPALSSGLWSEPVAGASVTGLLTSPRRMLAPLVTRDGVCAHLTVAQGTCSQGDGEVVVSSATATAQGLKVGDHIVVADSSSGAANPRPALGALRVVGVYSQVDDVDGYFFGRPLTARAPDASDVSSGDTSFVSWQTITSGRWRSIEVTVDADLDVPQADLDARGRLVAGLKALQDRASEVGAHSSTQLPQLLEQADAERATARGPLPLLALQAILLALVVLGYVAAATTEQRRAEVALARLRGQLPTSAARMLVRDLAFVVIAGSALGGVLGWLLARWASAAWLAPGIPVPVTWLMVAAAAASAAIALVAVVVTAVPTVREPLVTLLRAVPPRSSALRAGIADGVVVALCVAGLVTLLGDDAQSPTALIAPGLLALAGGLLLSQIVVPVAAAVGRAALSRGRLAFGLACVAVSRRPALRRLVAIETVAVALLVFAGAASSVGAHQREVAAWRQVGAAVVLSAAPVAPNTLDAAVAAADPSGRYAAGVIVAPSPSAVGVQTAVVDVPRFTRVALWDDSGRPGRGAPDHLPDLTPNGSAPVTLTGRRLTMDVDFSASKYKPPPDQSTGSALPEGVLAPLHLVVDVVEPSGLVHSVDLGVLSTGRHSLTAAVPCADGCTIRRIIVLRARSDIGTATFDLTVRGLAGDAKQVDLRAGDKGWLVASFVDAQPVTADPHLHVTAHSWGESLVLARLDVPVVLPVAATTGVSSSPYAVIGSGGIHLLDPRVDSPDLVTGPAITGGDQSYERVLTLDRLPGIASPAVLLSASLARERDGDLGLGALTQVWLAGDDPAREARLVTDLRTHGVNVTGRTTAEQVATAMGRRGTGLSLHLAQLVGVVALLLAASVLGVAVATSGRVRVYDLAGLRAAGLTARTVRSAAVLEQLLVAVVGVLAGAVLGAVGAVLALPRSAAGGLPAPVVSAGASAMVLATLVCAAVLIAVCAILGARLGRQAQPDVLRTGLR